MVRNQLLIKIIEVMSRVMRKPAFCICENKDADQLRDNREADQRLCFRYTESTIPLLSKSEISSLQPSSVVVQPGLCRKPRRPVFLPRGSNYLRITITRLCNILRILMAEKMTIFIYLFLFVLSCFCPRHRLWVHV